MDSVINNDDIYIYPELADINPMNFDEVNRCVEEGRKATLKVIDDINRKIAEFQAKS
ncbi:MAG: hypothetical protein GX160_06120 [Clostridiales bacterium]|nr:hypothetical protein [Clostridiales bacterium]